MKNIHPIQVFQLRFQVDHVHPKKFQLFEERRSGTNTARLFVILVTHRKFKMI